MRMHRETLPGQCLKRDAPKRKIVAECAVR